MTDQVRFEKRNRGFYDVRRLPALQDYLESIAEGVATRANESADSDEYKTSSQQGRKNPQGRWRTAVYTSGNHAKRDNAKNNTILRVIQSA